MKNNDKTENDKRVKKKEKTSKNTNNNTKTKTMLNMKRIRQGR